MSARTEKPTPYKLAKVREQGKTAKSIEFNYAIILLISLGFFWYFWPSYLLNLKELIKSLLNQTGHLQFSITTVVLLTQLIYQKLIHWWLPFAGVLVFGAISVNIGNNGWMWSTKALGFQWSRLHPKTNCQRLFTKRLMFDLGKNLIKLAIVSWVVAIHLYHNIPKLTTLTRLNLDFFSQACMYFIITALLQLTLVLVFLGFVDYLFNRWQFYNEQRMTLEELKEEFKHREGNPKIKTKIRQLQQKLRQKTASLISVKKADVIITNPTHLAIALQYNSHIMPAPKILVKAQGSLVKPVKLLAKRYRIPIIENKVFAQALYYSLEINQYLKEEHFPVAAGIFSEIYRQKAMNQ